MDTQDISPQEFFKSVTKATLDSITDDKNYLISAAMDAGIEKQVEKYLATAPKIHFSAKQQFVPQHLYNKLKNYSELAQPYQNICSKVYDHYGLPFKLYDYQEAWVNAFGGHEQNVAANGAYFEVGGGKTAAATVAALNHMIERGGHTIVLMPPILLLQWEKWLNSIEGVNLVTVYQGTPKQRKNLNLEADFVLMSIDIFKNDFEYLYEFFYTRNVTLIVDEAVSIKNHRTMNHICVEAFYKQDLTRYKRKQITKGNVKAKSEIKEAAQNKKVNKEKDSSAVAELIQLLKGKFNG